MCKWILSTSLPSVPFPYVNFVQIQVDKLTAINIKYMSFYLSDTSIYNVRTRFSQIKVKGISL